MNNDKRTSGLTIVNIRYAKLFTPLKSFELFADINNEFLMIPFNTHSIRMAPSPINGARNLDLIG
ncbi:hypothetical protein D3C80_1988550 [compost metagenome]